MRHDEGGCADLRISLTAHTQPARSLTYAPARTPRPHAGAAVACGCARGVSAALVPHGRHLNQRARQRRRYRVRHRRPAPPRPGRPDTVRPPRTRPPWPRLLRRASPTGCAPPSRRRRPPRRAADRRHLGRIAVRFPGPPERGAGAVVDLDAKAGRLQLVAELVDLGQNPVVALDLEHDALRLRRPRRTCAAKSRASSCASAPCGPPTATGSTSSGCPSPCSGRPSRPACAPTAHAVHIAGT